ncbi:MAG: glycosyltransferase [Bacteroidetes bacterium]|jgi:glycosyltransferase involved in cell wall biosynthesis|nr:glycosyltransferase [Bacteroidota bacterium]
MNKQPDVSLIIPVYNSSSTLAELFLRVDNLFTELNKPYQLVLIDDGSTDNSWNVIEDLKEKNPEKILAVKFSKNYGQHNAILCGFNYCLGKFIITMDDDLQHPPEEIKKFFSKYEATDADVIYGIPIDKKHSMIRNAGSSFVKKTSEYSSKKNTGGSSFRFIKREIVDIIKNGHNYNFLYLDATINQQTFNIEHVAVEHHTRKSGKSGYTMFKLITLYFNILINYSATPLKLMTYGGLFFASVAFFIGLKFIYKKLMHNVPLGYTSLMVTILFSTGLILFCLGIIGQYLYKLYQMQNQKPSFLIKQILK